ncbi:MAG: adenylosuccinate synthase, partial [Deltaproteobacteria bacterium]|nr:adenylosuccinate synthase [Deltaproteobacteria bacterium]
GTQWGDEGKGKIVDLLTEWAEVVVRFQGGNNAGHTLVIEGQRYALHLIPSGIMRPGKTCVIGSGVVVDLKILLEEIRILNAKSGRDVLSQLVLSDEAHVILESHRRLDQARERQRGAGKIGTTGRGIGPAYESKMARWGLRLGDLLAPDEVLRARLGVLLEQHNRQLEKIYGEEPLLLEPILAELKAAGRIVGPAIKRVPYELARSLEKGESILFEGAQGTLLDIDHGTYPFVTSSSTMAANACASAGVGVTAINAVVGVVKAYTTRVGSGPFPVELEDQVGEHLSVCGGEVGTTTGRPRRCGWLDMVALRYAVLLNGLSSIALTKLDVLSGLETIKVCEAYRLRGEVIDYFPSSIEDLAVCEPVLVEFEGWNEDISKILDYDLLPENARKYISYIEEKLGIKAMLVSVGPDRAQTIIRHNPFL